MATEAAEPMAVDAPEVPETQEAPHATPEKPQHREKAEAAPASAKKPEGGAKKDQTTPKKDKPAKGAGSGGGDGEAGGKRKGLYDSDPVVQGKRERKKVERLEPVVAVKAVEPTVKQARGAGARGRGRDWPRRGPRAGPRAPGATTEWQQLQARRPPS
jgi:hypothetical protein